MTVKDFPRLKPDRKLVLLCERELIPELQKHVEKYKAYTREYREQYRAIYLDYPVEVVDREVQLLATTYIPIYLTQPSLRWVERPTQGATEEWEPRTEGELFLKAMRKYRELVFGYFHIGTSRHVPGLVAVADDHFRKMDEVNRFLALEDFSDTDIVGVLDRVQKGYHNMARDTLEKRIQRLFIDNL